MSRYFIRSVVATFIITILFSGNVLMKTVSAETAPMTISQLVELLITIGAIAPDKADAARSAVTTLSQTVVTPVSTATTSLPYLQVLVPNGGEIWDIDVDVTYSISWGATNQAPVTISLVPSRGEVCNLTPTPIVSSKSTNYLNVLLKTAKCYNLTTGTSSALEAGTYKASISYVSATGAKVKDESAASFRINAVLVPSLTVTYPNGGESFIRGKSYDVKYSLKNVITSEYIYLYLLDSEGNTAFNSRKTVNSSKYTLDLPSNLSAGAYKVQLKLTTNDNVKIEDVSDNYFWISTGL